MLSRYLLLCLGKHSIYVQLNKYRVQNAFNFHASVALLLSVFPCCVPCSTSSVCAPALDSHPT